MAGEGRIGFQPNIYADDSQSLQQVWFDGEHGDAWGPSARFRPVLAYILGDMAINGVKIKEDMLQPIPDPSHPLGFLRRLLHWQKRYTCPLPGNQVRHTSCGRIAGEAPDPPQGETRMLGLIMPKARSPPVLD